MIITNPDGAASWGEFYAVGHPTVLVDSPRLSTTLGIDVTFATETFQRTGSFKFRAAYHVASTVSHDHLVVASSGNFGQALAYACQLLGKRCTVVMPHDSAAVKIDAVRFYGATVDLIDTSQISRSARVGELAARHAEMFIASSYDDPLVIAGNASLGRELAGIGKADRSGPFDAIFVPIGGGGLSAGVIQGLREMGDTTPVFAAEPYLANDAAESLRQGKLVRHEQESRTIADGVRLLSLGRHNWAILQHGLAGIVEVSEDRIAEALRVLFTDVNLKVEPTGGLSFAALLENPLPWQGKRVCCVVSGGNVDPSLYAKLLYGD